jgi:predicted dehydrogenase
MNVMTRKDALVDTADRADEIKVGLVGAGWISGVHAEAWAQVSGAKLVAVADIAPGRAKAFADKYRLPSAYESLEELLAQPDIVAIDVCTPPADHIGTGLKVLNAGKNLSLQKPVTLTLEECDQLTAAAERAGKLFMPSYMYRYAPIPRRMHELISEGRIGRPLMAFHRMAIPAWRPSPWAWKPEVSGGLIVEMLTHGFDFFIWSLGPVERVYAQATCSGKVEGFDDNVAIICSHKGGATSTIHGSWSAPDNFPSHRLEVIGTTGALHTEGGTFATAPMYRLVLTDGTTATAWDSVARGFVEKLQAFSDAIRTGSEPEVTPADGRAALEVALAAEKSIRTGSPIDVPLDAQGN